MATIKEVARLAGVSVATVSRALNQPESVKENTRRQVMEAVHALHYSPNFLGKNLRQLHTKRILVVLNSISNQFYSRVVRGIEDKARELDYNVLIMTTRDLQKNILDAISMIQTKVVDGAIFMTTLHAEQQISELNRSYPIVCACEPVGDPDISCVSIDNIQAGYDATKFLIENGKRRIALLGIESGLLDTDYNGTRTGSAIMRETGYRKALKEAGIPVDTALLFPEGLTYKAGNRCVKQILKLQELPDAVFAFSDAGAIGAIQALEANGIHVPQDISVIGFDNTAMSEVYQPSVTTIGQPQYTIGTTAMELLFERIGGNPTQSVLVQHRLIQRQSVCPSK